MSRRTLKYANNLFFKIFDALIFAAQNKGGAVAQSVEQRTENPCVGGSIPPHTTSKLSSVYLRGIFYLT
jgi:hypothetical protein